MAPTKYDAIVIGSGMTGGWAAKELCEKGLRTLVLEAGRPIDPDRDYVEHIPAWDMPFRGMRDRKKLQAEQPIQSLCYACEEPNSQFFVKDTENPYTTDPDKPFRWIRGRQVGGRSILWGRQSYRWSDLDFTANLRKASPWTGRSVTPISSPGTTTSRTSSAFPEKRSACRTCQIANSCLPCR